MSTSGPPIGGFPTTAQSHAVDALLGEYGDLEDLVVRNHVPLGFVMRTLMSTAFRLCWLYEADHGELFEALGTMASCQPEIKDPESFADHLRTAFAIFASEEHRDVGDWSPAPSNPAEVDQIRVTGKAVVP